MALKLVLDKIEDLDEHLRELYVEKDGKFHLEIEGYDDPAPIRATLTRAQRENSERRKQLEVWNKLGKTPDEVQELIGEVEELRKKVDEGHKPEDLEAIRVKAAEQAQRESAKLIKKAEEQAAAERTAREQIQSQYERSEVERTVMSAISQNKGNPRLLKATIMQYVKPVYEEGKLRLRVYDDAGDERHNTKGEFLTPFELVAEMAQQDEFAPAFEGSGNSGGGGKPAPAPGKVPPLGIKTKKDFGTGVDGAKKLEAFINKYPNPDEGVKAYEALPDA